MTYKKGTCESRFLSQTQYIHQYNKMMSNSVNSAFMNISWTAAARFWRINTHKWNLTCAMLLIWENSGSERGASLRAAALGSQWFLYFVPLIHPGLHTRLFPKIRLWILNSCNIMQNECIMCPTTTTFYAHILFPKDLLSYLSPQSKQTRLYYVQQSACVNCVITAAYSCWYF